MKRSIEELALDICKAREWIPEDVSELVKAAWLKMDEAEAEEAIECYTGKQYDDFGKNVDDARDLIYRFWETVYSAIDPEMPGNDPESLVNAAADALNVRIFPAQVSIDNGEHWYTVYDVDDIMYEIEDKHLWQALVNAMDDDTRETVHALLAPCEDAEFLEEYLYRAPVGCDLCIG